MNSTANFTRRQTLGQPDQSVWSWAASRLIVGLRSLVRNPHSTYTGCACSAGLWRQESRCSTVPEHELNLGHLFRECLEW